jgi:hypothetical protein
LNRDFGSRLAVLWPRLGHCRLGDAVAAIANR